MKKLLKIISNMSGYFDRVKDVKIYCSFCKKTWSGYIKENDSIDDITCPKCGTKRIEIKEISNAYDTPS